MAVHDRSDKFRMSEFDGFIVTDAVRCIMCVESKTHSVIILSYFMRCCAKPIPHVCHEACGI